MVDCPFCRFLYYKCPFQESFLAVLRPFLGHFQSPLNCPLPELELEDGDPVGLGALDLGGRPPPTGGGTLQQRHGVQRGLAERPLANPATGVQFNRNISA